MRIVVDTNVWLEWFVFDDPRVAPLAAALRAGDARACATEAMLAEFAAVVARPQFRLDADGQAARNARLREVVTVHPAAPDCRLPCTDPDDRMFIDLAVALRVDWLVSRDRALLRLRRIAGRRFGVQVGTPDAWSLACRVASDPATYNPHTLPPPS